MRSITLLLVLAILLSVNVSAQKNFKPGYIVTLQKDTVQGFILEGTDVELGLKMQFKKEQADSDAQTYTAGELLGFGFNYGRAFEQKLIVNSKENTRDSVYVFAKNIVKGKINVWVWRKEKKDVPALFLLNNESHQAVHLTQSPGKEIKRKDGRTYMGEDMRYVGLLNHIKGDTINNADDNGHYIRYEENTISKDIAAYNKKFEKTYPVSKYKEPFKRSYDITLLALPTSNHPLFRLGVYQNKNFYEKSKNVSFIKGITLRYNNSTDFLSIIPIGIKIHAASKAVIPYFYIGLGVAAIRIREHHVNAAHEHLYYKYRYTGFPTINGGAGIKIKVGSKFILFEVTPAFGAGILPNIGFSF